MALMGFLAHLLAESLGLSGIFAVRAAAAACCAVIIITSIIIITAVPTGHGVQAMWIASSSCVPSCHL